MIPIVDAEALAKTYQSAGRAIHALRAATLRAHKGERVAVVGPSGAGKSTLLNLLGLLDEPSGGSYRLMGRDVGSLPDRKRDALRRDSIGFVFQAYHVLGNLSVSENVHLKLATARTPARDRPALIADALSAVGLELHANSLGRHLSGGEKQRLAIARALVNQPSLVLADEPTGNLDARNADTILDLLAGMAARGIAVIVITHDTRTADWADRVVVLNDGVLADR